MLHILEAKKVDTGRYIATSKIINLFNAFQCPVSVFVSCFLLQISVSVPMIIIGVSASDVYTICLFIPGTVLGIILTLILFENSGQ